MAQSEAISGQGTLFKRNGVAVSEINSITGPGKSRETIDVTKLDDTDGYRQFIGSLRDPGSITLNMNFTGDGYDLFNGDFESDDLQQYEVELPTGKKFSFSGLVTELPLSIPIGDKVTMDVTIKISGPTGAGSSSSS